MLGTATGWLTTIYVSRSLNVISSRSVRPLSPACQVPVSEIPCLPTPLSLVTCWDQPTIEAHSHDKAHLGHISTAILVHSVHETLVAQKLHQSQVLSAQALLQGSEGNKSHSNTPRRKLTGLKYFSFGYVLRPLRPF